MNEATSKAIAAERAAAHLTIKELARKSQINERTLIRLLQNERNINVVQIAQLAEVFGIYPHELIESAERFITRSERGVIDMEAGAQAEDDSVDERSSESVDVDALADRIAAHPEDYELASNIDPNKEAESTTPREG